MVRFVSYWFMLFVLAFPAFSMPSIGGLQNNYSYPLEGTPNCGIAQGTIFIIHGAEMAGAGLLQGGFNPTLDKNLGGVSIVVTVNGVTTEAIPYYVSPGQIAAILPSATPVGDGVITVTFNGLTSAPYPIKVTESAFGFMTISGNGLGQAVVMDANFGWLTPANAAAEDQVVIFWGGGAFEGDETELIANPRNPDNLLFELYTGNKLAETLYHGRIQYPGLDQIVAKVPRGVTGCSVSAYAKTGNYISNFTTVPVAAEGGACSEPFLDPDVARTSTSQESITVGWLYLGRFTNHPCAAGGGTTTLITDAATAQFLRYPPFNCAN